MISPIDKIAAHGSQFTFGPTFCTVAGLSYCLLVGLEYNFIRLHSRSRVTKNLSMWDIRANVQRARFDW